MAESHNEREQRQALVAASKHLGRIADALETVVDRLDKAQAARSEHHVESYVPDGGDKWGWQCFTCGKESDAVFDNVTQAEYAGSRHTLPLADDDGPDPFEADCRLILEATGHRHALVPGAERWTFDPGTRHIACEVHEEPLYVGWLPDA